MAQPDGAAAGSIAATTARRLTPGTPILSTSGAPRLSFTDGVLHHGLLLLPPARAGLGFDSLISPELSFSGLEPLAFAVAGPDALLRFRLFGCDRGLVLDRKGIAGF